MERIHSYCIWLVNVGFPELLSIFKFPLVVLLHINYHNPPCLTAFVFLIEFSRKSGLSREIFEHVSHLHFHSYINATEWSNYYIGNSVVHYSWWLVKLINVTLQGRLHYYTVPMQVVVIYSCSFSVFCDCTALILLVECQQSHLAFKNTIFAVSLGFLEHVWGW